MRKLFFFIPVIFLIFATTITKNSTKELDKDSVVNILKENNKITRLLKNKTVIKTIYVSGKIINFIRN